ncbi:MAG TPA: ArgR family transcriptional regulator [Bacteroidales bacterium]|nr:ArgR family transcriptional regulator [Bacteroidales bacterium]
MQKADRLLEIEKIIVKENISSQEQLLGRLKEKGISCTQATLSRNMKQLGIGRIPDGSGGYKYAIPEAAMKSSNAGLMLNIVPVIRDIVEAKQLLVIKTLPGNASNTASYIDSSGRYEIAGTIAGDDTILIIPRDGISVQQVQTCLEIIFPGVHEHIRTRK